MLLLVHKVASWVLKRRYSQIETFMQYPHDVQRVHFEKLIDRGRHTKWGKTYGYGDIKTIDDFRERVPINTYETLYPWIERALKGEADVLWPGKMRWFSKSSGTTNDKSKFIPVTEESLEECHFKAGQDMLACYFNERPESKLFTGKGLTISGSHDPSPWNPEATIGDVSALLTENLPRFFELVRAPSREVALLDDWEVKIDAIAEEVLQEDITSFSGVPTWTLVLIRHIMEKTGLESGSLLEIWPNLELFMHGGVSFEPYRKQFEALIPSDQMTYLDVYNASEGFFAAQNDFTQNDLLLLLDHGIFYEFIPMEELGREHPRTHVLDEVEIGKQYAILISTNAGLWRYMPGDTVVFTSKMPYKIKVSGRTKQFMNAFGEELMVENAEVAMSAACEQTGAVISNFTAAPIYIQGNEKGGHEWLIEFEREPNSLELFGRVLDQTLQQVNSDYQAKRTADIALVAPVIRHLPKGTFLLWMKSRGKLGGQHKVPRLANERKYVEEIMSMLTLS